MPMEKDGVVKLIEEVGELQAELGKLQQLLAKKLAYWNEPHPDGVVKLIKEVGELQAELGKLQQLLAKKLAYWNEPHPDGLGYLNPRIQSEMGDVLGALSFTAEKLQLDMIAIEKRQAEKLKTYKIWDSQ